MCTISTGHKWSDELIHGPVGDLVHKTGVDQKKAQAKIKASELPVPTPPPTAPTTDEARAVALKKLAIAAGQQTLAATRSGTLATSPLGVSGYSKASKKTLLGA